MRSAEPLQLRPVQHVLPRSGLAASTFDQQAKRSQPPERGLSCPPASYRQATVAAKPAAQPAADSACQPL